MASSHYKGFKSAKTVERKLKTQRVKGIHPKELDPTRAYGVPNLPSDNMTDIMHNQFQSDYVEKKRLRDEIIANLRKQKLRRERENKGTKADELRGNLGRAMSKNLTDLTEDYYKKAPDRSKQGSPNNRSGSLLPAITKRGDRLKPDNEKVRLSLQENESHRSSQLKYKTNEPILFPTKPKYSYLERNQALAH